MPRVQVLYDDYESQGFVALAINLSENINIVKNYARQYTYPFLRDNGAVWGAYVQGGYIPLNYVIDPNGTVRYWAEGFDEGTVRSTIEQWFPVEHDVGVVRITSPTSPLDSGTSVTPACSVFNYGANVESYTVRMKIGSDYDHTADVTAHAVGIGAYVTFPAWTAVNRGANAFSCSTELASDLRPDDDRATGTTNVAVYDVALTAILAPAESVDSGVSVTPCVILDNPGTIYIRAKLKFSIGDFYLDSITKSILPSQCDTVNLPGVWIAGPVGTHAVKCTAIVTKDLNPANNVVRGSVRVGYHSGLDELPSGIRIATLTGAAPNPVAGPITIHYLLSRDAAIDLSIYSATGGLVRTLLSGHLPAGSGRQLWDGHDNLGRPVERGIYYCRLKTEGVSDAVKLVRF